MVLLINIENTKDRECNKWRSAVLERNYSWSESDSWNFLTRKGGLESLIERTQRWNKLKRTVTYFIQIKQQRDNESIAECYKIQEVMEGHKHTLKEHSTIRKKL